MKVKLLNVFKSIGLIFSIILFPTFLLLVLGIDLSNLSDSEYIFYLAISNLVLLVIFMLIYKDTLIKDFNCFKKNFIHNIEISFKYWFIGFIIMALSNLFINYILHKGLAGNEEQVRNYIDAFPLFMIFNTVIYAPITEELAFRKSVKDSISNKWVYVLTSGLVFGMLHISSYITDVSDLVYLIPYSSLGISFALLYYKTNNIFSSISMHAIHNLIAVIIYLIGVNI